MLDNSIQSTETKWFQWIKGDNVGKTVEWTGESIYDEHLDISFLMFKDGSRVNEELVGEWIIEVAYPGQGNPVSGQSVIKKETRVKPAPATDTPTEEDFKSSSPIYQILKDSKKTKVTINISLLVETPPANLMSVLAETYQDGENQVLDYISKSINIDDLKGQIARQIWLSAFEPDRKITQQKKTRRNGNESTED